MKALQTLLLLLCSNTFMTLAWYGHLKFHHMRGLQSLGLVSVILISWGIALLEYCFQVPANRMGFTGHGGPFSLVQLKFIQEIMSLSVFFIFSLLVFKGETWRLNHLWAALCLIAAVYFIFKH
jgi:uncharacterized protein (DUF486 family)